MTVSSTPRLLGWGFATALVMVLAFGGWFWLHPCQPALPIPDCSHSDPEVEEMITSARHELTARRGTGPAWGYYGMVLMAHDFATDAQTCFTQAERLDPEEPRWPYLHGLTLLLSDPQEAIPYLERAVERCHDVPLAPRLKLAEVLLSAGRVEEAGRHLHAAAAIDPGNSRLRFDQARLALVRNEWQSAVDHLTACVTDDHFRKQALELRAQVYRRRGDQSRAQADTKLAAESPEDAALPDPFADDVYRLERGLSARLKTVDTLLRLHRLDQAVPILEDTIMKYPKSPMPWLQLAQIRLEQGNEPKAEDACRHALEADPKSTQAWFWLGSIQAPAHPTRAVESFRNVLSLKPDHCEAHFKLGQCLKRLNDSAGAAEEFRLALRCKPDFAPAEQALQELAKGSRP